jgi:hypothetical protein
LKHVHPYLQLKRWARVLLQYWQSDCKGGAQALRAFTSDGTAMAVHKLLHDAQTQPRATVLARDAHVNLLKCLPNVRYLLSRDPNAGVSNSNLHLLHPPKK